MENSNQVHLSIDLSTEQGKNILAAVTAAVLGSPKVSVEQKAAAAAPMAKPAPAKAAPTPTVVDGTSDTVPDAEPEAKVVKMPAKPAPAKAAPTPAKPAPAAPKAAAPAPAKPAPAKPTPAKPAPAKPAATAKPTAGQILAVPYEEQTDDEGKLAHLMAHVTKHTKNGKGSDVKALLAQYSVDRASELDPEWYDSFNEAISRYSDGETVDQIFPDAN